MKSIPDNLSPAEAWKRLCSCPRLGSESVPLSLAFDHILAQDLLALEDIPSGMRSFRDGFAVRSMDVLHVPVQLRLVGEIAMGEVPIQLLGAGQTMAIPTGGFLPPGADAIVMQEDTERSGNQIDR